MGCMLHLVVFSLFAANFIMLIVLVRVCIGAAYVILFVGSVCYYVWFGFGFALGLVWLVFVD